LFDVKHYKKILKTSWLGQHFIYHESTESTNTFLKKMEVVENCHGIVCLADYQTGGRGQYKRKWLSKPGENLMFSIALHPEANNRILVLSLLAACAIADVIEKKLKVKICIKWPNDLYISGKKVAGILTETVFNGKKLDRIIIGVGLNVNQREFIPELHNNATSLSLASNKKGISREDILANALERIEKLYILWERNEADLIKMIDRRLIGYGQKVKISVDGEIAEELCTLLGINEEGHIVFLDENLDVIVYTYQQIRIIDVI